MHLFIQPLHYKRDAVTQDQFVKQSKASLNSEFFLLLDWFPNEDREPSLRKEKRICALCSAKWNTNSLIQGLNPAHHFIQMLLRKAWIHFFFES